MNDWNYFASHKLSITYQIVHGAIWKLQILGRFCMGNLYPSENPNLDMLYMYCCPECTIALLTLNSEYPLSPPQIPGLLVFRLSCSNFNSDKKKKKKMLLFVKEY